MQFKAHVQYDDWKGTAAADNADMGAISKHLQGAGLLSDSEFLIGFEVYVGATRLNATPHFAARAFTIQSAGFENARDAIMQQDPLPVTVKDLDLDLPSFFALFKRFSLVLTHRGLDLADKEYREI